MPPKPGHMSEPPQFPDQVAEGPSRKRVATRQYIPRFRSGAWAILRALETFPPEASVTKAEIVRVAQEFCDASFDTPLDNKYYTAWNSIKILLDKGYVYKSGNPARFCLTDEGLEVAKSLVKASEGKNAQESEPSQKRPRAGLDPQPAFIPPDSLGLFERPVSQVSYNSRPLTTPITNIQTRSVNFLPAGSYTIQFIMDNREIHSPIDKERLEREIGQGGVDYCVRSLDIGDGLWIAKSGSEEYVLDYIVERKRMDDLVMSIHDGRFHEQKV